MGYILIALGIIAIIGRLVILLRHNKIGDRPTVTQIVISTSSSTGNYVESGESSQNDEEVNSDSVSAAKMKGNVFEDFVVNLLADYRFTLLDRTQDAVSSAGVVAESCKNPDLHVRQKRGNTEIDYYIECKYRSHPTMLLLLRSGS